VNDPIPTVPSDSGGAERERRVPLSEQAYVAIKRLILRRELQAGDRLTEALLCERLSLGRNPVHIALHRLQREGLVEIVPRKWIVVRGETLDGFLELWNARLLIEPYLTELAAARADPALVDGLRSLLAEGRRHLRKGDRLAFMEIDRAVHRRLYEASGNRLLSDFANLLLDRSMRVWFEPAPAPHSDADTLAELDRLIDAVSRGEGAEARELMAEHVGALRHSFTRLHDEIRAAEAARQRISSYTEARG